jgi:putative FmdB family regulatory protein
MPSYDYACPRCGEFTLIRAMADRDCPAACPACRRPAGRSVSAPNLSLMNSTHRRAHQVNEKSRHSPDLASRHRCGSGCGCGSRTPKSKDSPTTRPIRGGPRRVEVPKLGRFETGRGSQRPWMLGH